MDSVFVLATGRVATAQALGKASELTRQSGASIILLVPHVTAFSAPHDPSSGAAIGLVDEYRDLAMRIGVDARVHVCVCRRMKDIFALLVSDRSMIVIGGRRGSWFWPTAERRLADDLTRCGHAVVFADIDRGASADAGFARCEG